MFIPMLHYYLETIGIDFLYILLSDQDCTHTLARAYMYM